MLKKLTEQKLDQIIEAGISEFAEKGLNNASMSQIARRAGISVGVLYKYYADKDDFFRACLRKSLGVLEDFVGGIVSRTDKPLGYARSLISTVQNFSRDNKDYIRMYHEVTSGSDPAAAAIYAGEIEGYTSRLYTEIIRRAQEQGAMRKDLDPGLFAFFFDNLLMMMQFSYSCPYYMERYKLYTGRSIEDDDGPVAEQLLKFMESAFTFSSDEITHSVTVDTEG